MTATRFARLAMRRALRAPERPLANTRLRELDLRDDVLRRLRPADLVRPRAELRDLRAVLERPRDERLDLLRPPRDLLPLALRALAIVTSPVAEFDSTVRKNRAHFPLFRVYSLNANLTPIIQRGSRCPVDESSPQ